MSERERWIVYPLLFLALGASLRDKLFDRTTTKRIVCEELTVIADAPIGRESPRPLVRIGRIDATPGNAAQGYMHVNGHVKVQGELDANQYAYRGNPFAPAAGVGPVITPADVIRAILQSQRAMPPASSSEAQPPQNNSPPEAPSQAD
jgi:hypothetical protein